MKKKLANLTAGLSKGFRGVSKSNGSKTITQPKQIRYDKMFAFGFLLLVMGFAITSPMSIVAQTTGSAPVFNATVQGQSASTVEGTFAGIVNYVGNVICPIGAGLMVAATVVQVKAGKSWVPTGVTAMGLLGVSGITRLIESMVTNGQSAVK
jgi:hypothetical protein